MNSERLRRLAETLGTASWPAARDAYLGEQSRKSLEQRMAELEESSLLHALFLLRIEKIVAGLTNVVERVKSAVEKCR